MTEEERALAPCCASQVWKIQLLIMAFMKKTALVSSFMEIMSHFYGKDVYLMEFTCHFYGNYVYLLQFMRCRDLQSGQTARTRRVRAMPFRISQGRSGSGSRNVLWSYPRAGIGKVRIMEIM